MTDPIPDLPLLRKVLTHVDLNRDQWHQGAFFMRTDCGTTACIAGWACLLSGDTPERMPSVGTATAGVTSTDGHLMDAGERGQQLLGLTEGEAEDLFEGYNSRLDVQAAAELIAARAGEALGVPLPDWAAEQ